MCAQKMRIHFKYLILFSTTKLDCKKHKMAPECDFLLPYLRVSSLFKQDFKFHCICASVRHAYSAYHGVSCPLVTRRVASWREPGNMQPISVLQHHGQSLYSHYLWGEKKSLFNQVVSLRLRSFFKKDLRTRNIHTTRREGLVDTHERYLTLVGYSVLFLQLQDLNVTRDVK